MKAYIGTKVLLAEPMTRGAYNTMRGWTPPEGEDQTVDGYVVQYSDGYQSWSPKEQFDYAYQQLDAGLSFPHALQLMFENKRVTRRGWNGQGMWLTLSPGGEIPADRFWAAHNAEFASQNGGTAKVQPYITMKTADDQIVPWVASQSDMLADDWVAVV